MRVCVAELRLMRELLLDSSGLRHADMLLPYVDESEDVGRTTAMWKSVQVRALRGESPDGVN